MNEIDISELFLICSSINPWKFSFFKSRRLLSDQPPTRPHRLNEINIGGNQKCKMPSPHRTLCKMCQYFQPRRFGKWTNSTVERLMGYSSLFSSVLCVFFQRVGDFELQINVDWSVIRGHSMDPLCPSVIHNNWN